MQQTPGGFVERLRAKQRALGLTQQDLALRLGVSESAVTLVYRGQRWYSWGFARAAVRVWPELAIAVAVDLAFGNGAAERGPPPSPAPA